MMDERQPYEVAKDLIGTPFHHMGRSVKGVDCVGLLILVARAKGWPVEDSPYYGRRPSHRSDVLKIGDYLRRNLGEPVDRPYQVNDVLLLKLYPDWPPSHVGLVAPHPYGLGIVHTYMEVDRVVYQRIDEKRHNQVVEVFEWANIQAKSLA